MAGLVRTSVRGSEELMDRDTLIASNGSCAGQSNEIEFEVAVLDRYGQAARDVENCLCLPIEYDRALLKVIPEEIIQKDYGCGDPSRYVRAARPFSTSVPAVARPATSSPRSSVPRGGIRPRWTLPASIKTPSAISSAITTSSFAAAGFKACGPISICSTAI